MRHIASFMKQRVRNIFTAVKMYKVFLTDCRFCLKYSITLNTNNKDKLRAKIMLLMHSIEKGMSFTDKKNGYGKEKAKGLLDVLKKYINQYGKDELSETALNILDKYFKDEQAYKAEDLKKEFYSLIKNINFKLSDNIGGVISVGKPVISLTYSDLYSFYKSRRSIRYFSSEEIADSQINKAIEFAKLTPTACNRQTSKVYSFNDKSLMKQILENQLGDQGWCLNADTLFVITGNQSYFGGIYERSQVFIDGGLFSMNFVMGLHAQNIATCFKMYVREPNRDKSFRKITKIPHNEVPIVLIFAGHYLQNAINIPQSVRL